MNYYRCEVNWSSDGVCYFEHPVLKETPCGVVVDVFGKPKFINKNWIKQYAHPTKEDALAGLKARRRRQIRILTAQLDRAKRELQLATEGKEFPYVVVRMFNGFN